jgi:hypothetical protein
MEPGYGFWVFGRKPVGRATRFNLPKVRKTPWHGHTAAMFIEPFSLPPPPSLVLGGFPFPAACGACLGVGAAG